MNWRAVEKEKGSELSKAGSSAVDFTGKKMRSCHTVQAANDHWEVGLPDYFWILDSIQFGLLGSQESGGVHLLGQLGQ